MCVGMQKPKKAASDDEDDDDDAGMNSFSRLDSGRDRSGRAKKEVKYFAESDNDDDDDDDMFDQKTHSNTHSVQKNAC